MNYIRRIMNSEEIEDLFDLPEHLKDKELEILILPVKDEKKEAAGKDDNEFNPDDYKGVLDKNEKQLKDDLEKMRSEWERL